MKVFNKDKALRQIKLKQNKNTYIKKVSIVLSCFILLVGIMYFTFAKFEQNSEEYTLINGKVKYGGSGDITLSYVVDGVSQSTPPAKGTGYKLKSYECTNADAVWDRKEWSFKLINMVGKVKCNLEFETATDVTVTLYSAAEDEVYYYDNSNEKVILGTTDSTGKLENITFEPGDYTIYSSVAKKTENQTEFYNKEISIDDESTYINIMPDGKVLYWYGYNGSGLNLTGYSIYNINTASTIRSIQTNSIVFSCSNSHSGSSTAWPMWGTQLSESINISNYNTFYIMFGENNIVYNVNMGLISKPITGINVYNWSTKPVYPTEYVDKYSYDDYQEPLTVLDISSITNTEEYIYITNLQNGNSKKQTSVEINALWFE